MSKAVVIGAVFGAAALRLRKMGYEVLVLDRWDQLVGRGVTYRHDGLTYDAGPTVITAPFLMQELFDLFGRQCRKIFERYKELLEDVFERKILAEDFSLYLDAPTRSDPSMAPPGHECFYVLAPVPNLQGNVNWKDVENLFFVGAGTHPGARLPGVLTSAKVLDRLVPRPLRGITKSEGCSIKASV